MSPFPWSDPARSRPQFWRLLLGMVVMAGVFLLWLIGMILAGWLASDLATALDWMGRLALPDTPVATLLLLSTFIGMALAPMAAARLMHGRGPATLLGPRARLGRDFAAAGLVVAGVYGIGVVLWSWSYDAVPNLGLGPWLALLPLTLAGIALQTLAEELVFRGYLMQQLGARFRSPLIWLVLPALLFGVVHYDPANTGTNAWAVVASATLFGLVAGDLTQRTGSLGAAWGLHFANNLLAIGVLATKGTITGLALQVTPYGMEEGAIPLALILADMGSLVLVWAILRRLLPAARRSGAR